MIKKKTIRYNVSQILALTEKNIKLNTRFKVNLIVSFITPIISILMPLIVFGKLFEFSSNLGPWNEANFLVFTFIAYIINLLAGIISEFPLHFIREKYWKTLPVLIIGPLNRFNLLFGIFLSRLVVIAIPVSIFFILGYIYYPISFLTVLAIIGIFFLLSLIFSGIGLIMGIFAISHENIWKVLAFGMSLLFWASCLTYPFEIFPGIVQNFIELNPLYYIFDVIRLIWLENDIIITFTTYPFHFIILFLITLLIPLIAVYIFNKVFKKYGIVGY